VNRSDLVFGMKQRNATGSAPTGFGAIELEKTEFGMTSDTTCVGAGLLPGGSETILVVEDEAFVREAITEILSSVGYRVLEARSAAEALLVFHRHQYDIELLLTDVVLPDRNGCDLASEFARLCRNVRTIFTSGYPENAVTRQGFCQRGWRYLPKPFSGEALLVKVAEVLQSTSVETAPD
jgi:CheY-like chemotaxis protein